MATNTPLGEASPLRIIYLFLFLYFIFLIPLKSQNCWNPLDSVYTMGFEDTEVNELDNLWIFEDNNGDGDKWLRYYEGMLPRTGSYSLVSQLFYDWSISRCFYFIKGKEYQISFWYYAVNQTNQLGLSLAISNSQESNNMKKIIFDLNNISTSDAYKQAIIKYIPDSTGIYYLGWKAYGLGYLSSTKISVDDIEIKEFVCFASIDLPKDTTVCSGYKVKLDAGDAYTNYLWMKDDIILSQTRYLTVKEAGIYTIEVKDQYGCESSDKIQVKLFSYPQLICKAVRNNSAYRQDTIIICKKAGIKLVHNVTEPLKKFTEVKWYSVDINNNEYFISNGDTLTVNQEGTYFFSVYHKLFKCDDISFNRVKISLDSPYSLMEIDRVTFDPKTGRNNIYWNNPAIENNILLYMIYRETEVLDKYELAGTVAFPTDSFIDFNQNASLSYSKYKLSIMDTCNDESFQSKAHKTIKLNISDDQNIESKLGWDNYEGVFYDTYRVFRSLKPDMSDSTVLANLPALNMFFTDSFPIKGVVNYYVVGIIDKSKNNQIISYSNTVANTKQQIHLLNSNTPVFNLFPNPANNNILLSYELYEKTKLNIDVYSITGVKVLVLIDKEQAPGNYNYRLPQLNKGLYFIKIRVGDDILVKRLIIK
ncbi:MAG: T9SS type A sorting domain-containing protein [Bacteroidales bacterium]|nr:T9SS type A sorting domain-containing protein [Bacteroidales bacterium]